jgi:pyrimidine operon attenuation protein/uracil phosphoribosyltransferase
MSCERNKGRDDLFLVGIRRRGAPLAARLAAAIREIERGEVPVGVLDISRYRDDLALPGQQPVRPPDEMLPVKDKKVILVDDVLYTGRTIRAALDANIDQGRPAVSAGGTGRPGTPGTADPRRLRRQERPDFQP